MPDTVVCDKPRGKKIMAMKHRLEKDPTEHFAREKAYLINLWDQGDSGRKGLEQFKER